MTDMWTDLQWRAEVALSKSHILAKRLMLMGIVVLAFAVRVLNFVRLRGRYEFGDIFNLGWNGDLSSGTGVINYFKDDSLCCKGTYPGLATLVSFSECGLAAVGLPMSTQAIYTFIGPVFAALTSYVTYHLGKHLKDDLTGLLAAAMVAIIPGFYGISADGRAANVVVGTFAVSLCVLFFLKSMRSGSVILAVFAGVTYAALGSLWSGYIFMLYLASAYVVVMIFFDKVGSSNLYNTFSVFYLVGTGLCVFLPVFGFQGFLYLEQFPGIAAFALLQIARNVSGANTLIAPIGGVLVIAFVAASVLGILSPSTAFFSFLAQITSGNGSNWVSFYRDLHLVLFLFPAGVVFCFRKRSDSNIFFVVYALTAVALSSFSTHYTPVLCPAASCLAALSVVSVLRVYYKHQSSTLKKRSASTPVSKEIGVAVLCGVTMIALLFFAYSYGAAGHPAVYRPETSIGLISRATNERTEMDDFREAHSWLRHNTPADTKLLSWKGIGHKISTFARDSFLGNNLERPTNLDTAATVFKANEDDAAKVLAEEGVEYVVLIFGGACGFRDDDINRVNEIAPDGQFEAQESVLYKLSYNGFADVYSRSTGQMGFDSVRRQQITIRPTLTNFEEVFTSEHWVVRVYKVLPPTEDAENADADVEDAENADVES